MRKLAWAAGAFSAAVFLAEYLLPVKGLPYIAAVLFLLSPLGFLWKEDPRRRWLLVFLAAALGLGAFWLHYERRIAPCEALAGERLVLTGEVTDYPTDSGRSQSVTLRLTDGPIPGIRGRFYLYEGEMTDLGPGDILRLEVKISDEPEGMADKNIILFGYMTAEPEKIGQGSALWRYLPQRLAQGLKTGLRAAFPPETAPFVTALLTGDTGDLKRDEQAYSDLRLAGMAHAVAVSGMHVCYLVGLVQLLFGRGKRASLICFPVLILFALMTGASPSVLRAVVLQSLLLLAPMLDRERDGPTALLGALAFLLILNPSAAGSISLQLSFAAAAGMEWLLPGLQRWRQRRIRHPLPAFVLDSLFCTLGASVFTVPLSALYFGTIPLMAPVSNLLTLSILSWIFAAGFVLGLIGLVFPAGAAVLAWGPSRLAELCQGIYARIAAMPNACLYTDSRWAVLWLALVYALFALFYALRDRKRRFRPAYPAALSLGALALLILASTFWGTRGGEFTVLDVGQGSCSVLRTGGAVLVVDCGGSDYENAGDTAANYLLSQGQRDVDALVLTHLHADHADGVVQLLHRMPVQKLLLPADAEDDDDLLPAIRTAAEEEGTELIFLTETMRLSMGKMDLWLCQPLAGENENERGLVLWGTVAEKRVVITGDLGLNGELALLQMGLADKTDILLVGHHGSSGSSSHMLLNALRPEWALISVGENYYGHPATDALERLFAYAGQVRRTDLEGTITIRID